MSTLLPAWRQQVLREREAELIFRGEQYARAIALYYVKNNNTLPPSIDILISQHHLRKKYLDPITGEEFLYLGSGLIQGSTGSTLGRGGLLDNVRPIGSGGSQQQTTQSNPAQACGGQPGICGVRSKSSATSIKVYEGQQQYDLWPFTYQLAIQRGAAGGQSRAGGPGGRQGGPGAGRGGRGGEDQPIGPGGRGGRGGLGGRGGDGGRGGGGALPLQPVRPGGGGAPPPPPTGGGRGGGS
ncbi:MAG: hypothetical protein R2752_19740 [Vicinamibacterales bacterium]